MKKIAIFLIALLLGVKVHAQVCPLPEAVDFIAKDYKGNDIHLFDILDSGQSVFIHFFVDSYMCGLLVPFMNEAFSIMGCNMHDVHFMEISHRETDIKCQAWTDRYNIAYTTIGADGGGEEIELTYGIEMANVFILIMPDRSITIHGHMELYPFATDDIINALAQYGGLQPHPCTGQMTVETDTVFVSNVNGNITPGRLAFTNLTAEDVTINSFSTDQSFGIRCMYKDEDVTNGGLTMQSGINAAINVYVDDSKGVQEGKIFINTSAGTFETALIYDGQFDNTDESHEQKLSLFPNPANNFIIINGENLGTVMIFNALGQKIDEFKTESEQLRISTMHYPDGTYFVKFSSGKTAMMMVNHNAMTY